MQFMKRLFLVMVTNILVMLTIGVLMYVLMQYFPALQAYGYGQLMIIAVVWGFGGAIVSLMLSRVMAKWMGGMRIIKPSTAQGDERWLVQTVHRLAEKAGITTMPEVGIWDSPEINAFCTGPGKNSSLVAVSTGILRHMNKDELEGVLAHEISHAGNGDMVTMTLIQGVVNSFVIFFSFIIARILMKRGDNDSGGGLAEFMVRQVLQIVLSLVAYVAVIAPFSRWREYRADAGGAQLAGRQKMIAALQALLDSQRIPQPAGDPAMATMMIRSSAKELFSTHPRLEDRIARLRQAQMMG
jgi:heat shock protein HtpX